jgi:hypothetical protein
VEIPSYFAIMTPAALTLFLPAAGVKNLSKDI